MNPAPEPEVDPVTKALQDEIFLAKVARAREQSMAEKFMLGFHLFDANLVWMRAGIRSQFPHFSDEEVAAEVRRRLRIAKQLDDGDRYRPVEEP